MTDILDISIYPWPENGGKIAGLPREVMFLCAYYLHLGVESFKEEVYFHRSRGKDELWIVFELGPYPARCAVIAQSQGDESSAGEILLDALIRSRISFGWPSEFIRGGLINDQRFMHIVNSIKEELERNAEEARIKETEIVRVARELDLHPRPTGEHPDHWQAKCPETNHPIYIDTGQNYFFCGWCRRNGGPNELRSFVEERKSGNGPRIFVLPDWEPDLQ